MNNQQTAKDAQGKASTANDGYGKYFSHYPKVWETIHALMKHIVFYTDDPEKLPVCFLEMCELLDINLEEFNVYEDQYGTFHYR